MQQYLSNDVSRICEVTANYIFFNNIVLIVLLRFPLQYIVLLYFMSNHNEIFHAVFTNTKGNTFQENIFTIHYPHFIRYA